MSWPDFYLVCFLVGFLLSLVAFLSGSAHLHLPGLHHVHGPHVHLSHASTPAHAGAAQEISPLNLGTLAAFLAWFGGTGYLLARFSGLWFWFGLLLALAGGLGGAAFVFWFLVKVLLPHDRALDPADYEMVGVLARVSSQIRQSGTGEIVFSQAGARHSAPARSEDRSPIPKDAEVVVTRYEQGVAYVRRWEDLTEDKEMV